MNGSWKAGIVLVLFIAVLAVWLAWRGLDEEAAPPPAPAPIVERSVPAPAPAVVSEAREYSPESAPEPAPTPDPDPPGLVIAGVVVTEDGAPAAGAVVAAYSADTGATRASVGEDGSFRVVGLGAGKYRVSAVLDHYNEAVLQDVAAGSSRVRLVLEPLSAVEGRVIDATTGAPVAEFNTVYLKLPPGDDAHWQTIVRSETTAWQPVRNNDGRYRIDGVASGGGFAVGARAPGYGPKYVKMAALKPGQTGAAPDLALEPESRIAGFVATAQGDPVGGAAVYLGREARGRTVAWSSSDGRFTIGQLPRGPVELTAAHRDYLPATVEVVVGRGEDTAITIVLGGGGGVEGYVVNGGEPASGVTVTATRLTRPRVNKQVVADAKGYYAIRGISPGVIEIIAEAQGQGDAQAVRVQKQAEIEDGLTTIVDFDLGRAASAVEGYVTVGGQPQAGAQVRGFVTGAAGDTFFSVDSQEDGWYVIDKVPAGSGWLDVTVVVDDREQHKKVAVDVPARGTVRQDIDLSGTGSISGTVETLREGEGGQVMALIGKVDVEASDFDFTEMGRMQIAESEIGPDGAYVLNDLEDDTYTLVAVVFDPDEAVGPGELPTLRLASEQVTVAGGQPVQVNLVLP